MNWVPSFLYFWILANPKNRRRLRYRGTTSMHYVRAWQSLKYMDTELVMRAGGFKHEEDSDIIMQSIRATSKIPQKIDIDSRSVDGNN